MDERLKICTIILIIFFVGFLTRIETVKLKDMNSTEKAYFTDDNGLPYMYEPDSYYNYRLTANILDHGHPGDTVINGKPWDLHSYYPPGGPVNYPPLILWLSIVFYKFLNLFIAVDLMEACFWLPAIIGPLAGIPTFFFVRRYAGNLPGLLAGILLVLAPFYFARTIPGFYDTDMFNILFPVLVAFFFSKAVETKNYSIPLFLSSLSLVVFSLAWQGWLYIFCIIVFSDVFYLVFLILKKENIRDFSKKMITFIMISLAFIMLFVPIDYISIFQNFFTFIFKSSYHTWPGVYESVSELQTPNFEQFLSAAGPLNMCLGLLGIIIITGIVLRNRTRKMHFQLSWYPFFLIITWLIIGNISYSLSIRFALLAIPPFTIFTGLFFGVIDSYLEHSPYKQLKKSRKVIILALITLLSAISILQASEIQLEPFVDDDLVLACDWIKNETNQSTIIISEWSYGSPLAALSQRPVFNDNTRQSNFRIYWFYHAFATNNESLSVGIFTMLSTNGNKAIELLDNKTGNTSLTVAILDDILGIDKKEAKRILEEKYYMNPTFASELLTYTHPSKKKSFIIVTNDNMVLIGQWCLYYGLWDFNKSRGHDYIYSFGLSNDTGMIRKYSNNVTLNLNTGGSLENKKPYNTLINDGNSTRIIPGNKKSNFTIIFLLDKNWNIIINKNFQDSLFVKLVILKEETEHFRPIYKNNSTIIWVVK